MRLRLKQLVKPRKPQIRLALRRNWLIERLERLRRRKNEWMLPRLKKNDCRNLKRKPKPRELPNLLNN